jgi:hypothetical protein
MTYDKPDFDHEIVEARAALAEALAAYDTGRRGRDQYDTFHIMKLKSAVTEADRRLGTLQSKKEAGAGEPLRSSSQIFFSSDH